MTLLTFVLIRGTPLEIFSQNGTNLVGAQMELETLVEDWSTGRTFDRFMQKGVYCNFNPLTSVTEEEYGRSWRVR